MNIVFTICSNNYLAHAATLMQSWFRYHPETIGYVILVDELNREVRYEMLSPAEVIEIRDIHIEALDSLANKFNITELNTAVKPEVFQYLFDKHPDSCIIYLDPDILVKGEFNEVFYALKTHDFVLTPHICQPVDDDWAPTDYHTLRTGIFNLGFIGLKYTKQVKSFLHWWKDRVYKYGYCKLSENMFYDQLWINYIPVFYEHYYILKHPGYNMANWNLHERFLIKADNEVWKVNENFELKFFHFSGYQFTRPEFIGSYHTRYDFQRRPDLKQIFNEYQGLLVQNGAINLKNIPCVYFERYKAQMKEKEILSYKKMPFRVKLANKIISFVSRKLIYG